MESLERFVDQKRGPHQRFEDGEQVSAEGVGLLPEVHQCPDEAEAVDGVAAAAADLVRGVFAAGWRCGLGHGLSCLTFVVVVDAGETGLSSAKARGVCG